MTTRSVFNEKPYVNNLHVLFEDEDAAFTAPLLRRSHLRFSIPIAIAMSILCPTALFANFENSYTFNKVKWHLSADKVVEIPTFHVGGVTYPRTLRLKLSALTTGDYEGCATPELPAPKVIVGLREE